MGRSPCCAKEGLNRGAWSAREDRILTNYINTHGEGKWRDLPQKAGLRRCGKSCRLRWLNYLRPDIKRGNISVEEEELIIRLHKLLGNRWSLIAGRLPGRTDNEIKNYWNTNLSKKFQRQTTQKQLTKSKGKNPPTSSLVELPKVKVGLPQNVIRTKAVRCTKLFLTHQEGNQVNNKDVEPALDGESPSSFTRQVEDCSKILMDFDIDEIFISDALKSDFLQVCGDGIQDPDNVTSGEDGGNNFSSSSDCPFSALEMLEDSRNEAIFENWRCDPLQPNAALELNTLSSLLESEDEWMERK